MVALNRMPIVPLGNPSFDINAAAGFAVIRDTLGAPARAAPLDTLGTFTRASPAWGYGSDGLLGRFEAGVRRTVYDPITKACRGALLESSSLNFMLWSSSFDQSIWAKSGVSLFSSAVTGIDGRNTGTRLVDGNSIGNISQSVSAVVAFNCSGVFLRRPDGVAATRWRLRGTSTGGSSVITADAVYDLASGQVVSNSANSIALMRPGPLGYYRVQLAIANTVGATGIVWSLERANSGDTNAAVDICEWSAEPRLQLTSPMPTGNTITQRAADRWSVPVGPWFNFIEGEIYAEFSCHGDSLYTDQAIATLRNDAASSAISLTRSRFGPAVVGSGTTGANAVMYGADNNTDIRAAVAWQSDKWAAVKSGGFYIDANTATSTGAVPTGITTLDIGHYNGGLVLDGVLPRMIIRPIRLSNTALSDDVR